MSILKPIVREIGGGYLTDKKRGRKITEKKGKRLTCAGGNGKGKKK